MEEAILKKYKFKKLSLSTNAKYICSDGFYDAENVLLSLIVKPNGIPLNTLLHSLTCYSSSLIALTVLKPQGDFTKLDTMISLTQFTRLKRYQSVNHQTVLLPLSMENLHLNISTRIPNIMDLTRLTGLTSLFYLGDDKAKKSIPTISFPKDNCLKRYHIDTRNGWSKQLIVAIHETSDFAKNVTNLYIGDNIYLQNFFQYFPSIVRFKFDFDSCFASFPYICHNAKHLSIRFTKEYDECKHLAVLNYKNVESVSIKLNQPACQDMMDDLLEFTWGLIECRSLKLTLHQGLTHHQIDFIINRLTNYDHIEFLIPEEIVNRVIGLDFVRFDSIFELCFDSKIWIKQAEKLTKKNSFESVKYVRLFFDRK